MAAGSIFPSWRFDSPSNGRSLTTPCLIGAPGALPLLGAVTLEALGLAPDPVQRVLVPVTGLLLCQASAGHP